MKYRCAWAEHDELSKKYHDERWGRVCHEDHELFAMLVLEGMQAGLSWQLILKREAGIRSACDNLDPNIIAMYDEQKVQTLINDDRMIKSINKIRAMVNNAQVFLDIQKTFGSFDAYIWSFTNGQTIDHHIQTAPPAYSELSEVVSNDLKKKGFKFVGKVIVQSYLEAIGIINSHHADCFVRGIL